MTIQFFALLGIVISVILLLIGLCFRATDGLFFSRTLQEYNRDRHDPKYELERQIGIRMANALLRFSPSALLFFILLFLLTLVSMF